MTERERSATGSAFDLWPVLCDGMRAKPNEMRSAICDLIQILDTAPPGRSYRDLPLQFFRETNRLCREAKENGGKRVPDLILLELISRFDQTFERARIPEIFLPEFLENIRRILDRAAQPEPWAFSAADDIFLKDLGILRTRLIPCVSHLIFPGSGIPRRLVICQSPQNLTRALKFFVFRSHGLGPFMENHVHPAMLTHFSPEGRERCYRLVAELLKIWPGNKGLMGLSWYYDPKVSQISPNLAYLRSVPVKYHALFLPAGTGQDVVNGAIMKSAKRRLLYERGLYNPTRYLMAWSRRDIIDNYGS